MYIDSDESFVTVFEGPQGEEYYRSGRFVGNLVIEEGYRPYKDQDITYTNCGFVKTEIDDPIEATFDVADSASQNGGE